MKHPSNRDLFLTHLNGNNVKAKASREQETSYWWHDCLLPRARFTPPGFEDQVWAWLHSDWLRRPGPCSLWSPRACHYCYLQPSVDTPHWHQLWGTHCICLFRRLVLFMNNMCAPCFAFQWAFLKNYRTCYNVHDQNFPGSIPPGILPIIFGLLNWAV